MLLGLGVDQKKDNSRLRRKIIYIVVKLRRGAAEVRVSEGCLDTQADEFLQIRGVFFVIQDNKQ